MNTPLRRTGIALLLLSIACVTQAQQTEPAKVASEPAKVSGDPAKLAGDTCEAAVAETVRRMRGPDAQEVQFIGTKRAISPSPGDEIGVKGEGRYHSAKDSPKAAAVAFTYSCAFNAETHATNGVVFKEVGGVRPSTEAPWQPDLTQISPEACDAATAAALKEKYPRVGRIAFDGETRKLKPAPNAHASLEGQGAVERAPGMNLIPFSYRCEFNPRNGKLIGVETKD